MARVELDTSFSEMVETVVNEMELGSRTVDADEVEGLDDFVDGRVRDTVKEDLPDEVESYLDDHLPDELCKSIRDDDSVRNAIEAIVNDRVQSILAGLLGDVASALNKLRS